MPRLFATPHLDLDDLQALEGIHGLRRDMASMLRAPHRWSGGLRRTTQARAIQGSNSIEGYTVTEQDAAAAVDDEEPLTADELTWREIVGYRRVLTYVLQTAGELQPDAGALKAMHFMLLEHDLSKGPGRFRAGPVYVHDDTKDEAVYEGPDSQAVPALVNALADALDADRDLDPLVRAAMAHLNLVMIHPFRDGNGRMARVLQTLVLAQDEVIEPTFSSIEEWLGANTADYYAVLAATGRGAWHPENDAHLWVKFCLRAQHMQAQTLQRRFAEASTLWSGLDDIVARHHVPGRATEALFDATLGLRVQRSGYLTHTGVEDRTATRDLTLLVREGLLTAQGQTRGRYYLAGEPLVALRRQVRGSRAPLEDPFPTLMAEVRRAAR